MCELYLCKGLYPKPSDISGGNTGLGREIGLWIQNQTWFAPVLQFASTSGELEQHFVGLCENPDDGSHPNEKQGLRRRRKDEY